MEREDALGDSGDDDDEGGFPERIWAVLKDREATQTGRRIRSDGNFDARSLQMC